MLCSLVLLAAVSEYTLVWSDEFDRTGAPDPAKWTYELGHIRNDEVQYYTNRPENVRVESGKLVIEARKDNWEGHPVTSASITTEGRAEWTHARMEVRAKVPEGRGVWPAIWMLGTNRPKVGWPRCGEIDIMEYVGFDPHKLHGTIHCEAFNHMVGTSKGANLVVQKPFDRFIVYSVDWTPSQMDFFIDGKRYFSHKKTSNSDAEWPFDKPFYLLINLAIGGSWGGQKGVDEAIYPARYEIDYVRVYQKR